MRNYIIGVKKEVMKKYCVFNSKTGRFILNIGDRLGSKKNPFWTGYNVKEDDKIWIKQLNADGAIICKCKIIKWIKSKKRKGNKNEFILEVEDASIISAYNLFFNHKLTANSNHGEVQNG